MRSVPRIYQKEYSWIFKNKIYHILDDHPSTLNHHLSVLCTWALDKLLNDSNTWVLGPSLKRPLFFQNLNLNILVHI